MICISLHFGTLTVWMLNLRLPVFLNLPLSGACPLFGFDPNCPTQVLLQINWLNRILQLSKSLSALFDRLCLSAGFEGISLNVLFQEIYLMVLFEGLFLIVPFQWISLGAQIQQQTLITLFEGLYLSTLSEGMFLNARFQSLCLSALSKAYLRTEAAVKGKRRGQELSFETGASLGRAYRNAATVHNTYCWKVVKKLMEEWKKDTFCFRKKMHAGTGLCLSPILKMWQGDTCVQGIYFAFWHSSN